MRTGRIINILLLTFISIFVSIDMNANTPVKPDFAYPKTVSAQAEQALSKALKAGDGPAITRALMDFYLARTRIDAANAGEAIAKIDSICQSSSDPVLKAMLLTLQADIYSAVYSSNRWKYDSRNLPATPLPADFNEWSGEQFRSRITGLLSSALSYESDLQPVPINQYASVIDLGSGSGTKSAAAERLAMTYYPTLFDFVATRSIVMLMSTGHVQSLLSWGLLTRHDFYVTLPFSKYDPVVARILGIYSSLLKFHRPGTAPFINSDLGRIDFISSHIYTADSDDSDKIESRKSQLLRELYTDNETSEFSGDILLAIANSIPDNNKDSKWLYSALNQNIKSFPAYSRRNDLSNARLRIKERHVFLNYPEVAAPGIPVKLNLDIKNVKSGKIYIYNVSSSPVFDRGYNCTGLPSMKPVAVLNFTTDMDASVPFEEKQNLDHTFPDVGTYIAIATIDGVTPTSRRWYEKINVTRYSLAASQFDKTMVWALDAMNGAPVEGAKITLDRNRRNRSVPSVIGMTGKDGSLDLTASGNVMMTKDGDRYALPVWIYNSERNRSKETWRRAAAGYSSLPLYHPGDSVDWMSVLYDYKGRERRPVIAREVTAMLHDANHREIDTLKLVTDEFGRVQGRFLIPKESLSGRFSILVDSYSDAVSFMVSDYKLPTYRVILDPVEKDYPTPGDVTLRGRLETYAGFPVGDAKLTLDISATPKARWWWDRPTSVKFYTLDSTSDAAGKIEITIPKDVLAISPIPGGIFSAALTALSPAGETQTASTIFSTGERYIIRASAPRNIDITSATTEIKANVVNYQDSLVAMPVNLSVMRDSAERFRTVIAPGQTSIDLSALPSGEYELRFSLADSTMAEATTLTAVLYRPTDKETPLPGTLLWYPEEKVMAGANGNAAWLYAVDCPTNLLVTIHGDTEIISRRWVEAPKGMNTLTLSLPEGVDNARMSIAATGNYRTSDCRIEIKREAVAKGLKFITESFRDRLIPGGEETWTFRVVDESGEGKKSAVVLDMYNTALNALATQPWSFNPRSSVTSYFYEWIQNGMTGRNTLHVNYLPGKYQRTVTLIQPDFNTYGLPLAPDANYRYGSLRIRGARAMMNSAARADELSVVREHAEEVEVEEVLNTVKPTELVISSADYAAEPKAMLTGSVKMEEEAADGASMDGGENGATQQARQEIPFTYRDSEVPLAFFRPMLTTDDEGRLTFTFIVPNANTTWGFKALAYTDSLMSTAFSTDVVASKPVMVQPNLPRFLRAGDRATVLASVMNGSEKEQTVETRIELFDATDGKTIREYTQRDIIAAGSSTTVGITVDAPTDAPFTGYRIKSSTDRFADGEQTLIPILQAVSPVIDTYPFYIAPEEKKFSMDVPKVPSGARVTLQFCDNPTWYVVTALPGILDIEASTANEAAASIFSAAIADGLLRDNPSIAEAIREWSASDRSDRTLTSMLERNEDLKQVLLASTPWMLDAKNDTERMSRLMLLFDKKTVSSTMKANIAALRKLVRDGGGWAWNSACDKPSLWVTENVLLLLGKLRALGYMPESQELDKMTAVALRWIDSENKKTFKKYPESDFTLYVYLRDRFKDMKGVPEANRAIVNATVQRILASWKSASVFDKAVYAQILAKNSYPGVAKTILSSLREYSEYSPTKGMWWPSLDNMTLWSMDKIGTTALLLETFAEIEPGCQDIDRIRQWLILQKEAKDWGTSVTTSSAVAAILSTSATWVEPAKGAKISVCGKNVEPERIERLTGYFRTRLPLTAKSKGQMKVDRESDTPSWGALFYLYTDSITSIKAHSCPELSIDKAINVNGQYTDALKVGDKVSVTLTLHVDRDMDYVTIVDERPACYEPTEQMPTPLFSEGIYFYRENRDSSTRLFIDHLPKGTYILTYDVWVNNAGEFASGVATVQSQYAPQFTAHTSGTHLSVSPAGK